MRKKHIVMLLSSQFPPDIRVEKEMRSLIDNNYSVSILCATSKDLPTVSTFKNATIYRYIKSNLRNRIVSKLCMKYNFIHPAFLSSLKKLYKIDPFDVIHVHDLPLANTAMKFKNVITEGQGYIRLT